MYALVVRVTIKDEDAATTALNEQVVPRASQAPGFKAGYWTRKDDNGLSDHLRVRGAGEGRGRDGPAERAGRGHDGSRRRARGGRERLSRGGRAASAVARLRPASAIEPLSCGKAPSLRRS
jgi:hypothetical protein